jgi:hypothetical protein
MLSVGAACVNVVSKNAVSFCVTPCVFINTEISKQGSGFMFEVEERESVRDKILLPSDTFVLYLRTECQETSFVMKAIIMYKVKCSNILHHSIGNAVFIYGTCES